VTLAFLVGAIQPSVRHLINIFVLGSPAHRFVASGVDRFKIVGGEFGIHPCSHSTQLIANSVLVYILEHPNAWTISNFCYLTMARLMQRTHRRIATRRIRVLRKVDGHRRVFRELPRRRELDVVSAIVLFFATATLLPDQ
jgi:hypothetical protein